MKTIVVGGGLGGVLTSLLLRESGHEVVLIEKAPQIGGLLRSQLTQSGDIFDFGTHLIGESGNPYLDSLLIEESWKKNWHTIVTPLAGNYTMGKLNQLSPFPDIRSLPKEIYNQAVVELIHQTQIQDPSHCLEEYLQCKFGLTVTDVLYRPIFQKLCGTTPLKEMSSRGVDLFGLKRLIAFGSDATNLLKSVELYDEKFAFHTSKQGGVSKKQYYPKRGGVGEWMQLLQEKMSNKGIQVLCGTSIKGIEVKGKQIRGIATQTGETIPCDALFWTLPPALFLKTIGEKTEPPPLMRDTNLVHLTYDQKPITDLDYFWNYDSNHRSGRVTLYSNFQETPKNARHRITVECFSDKRLQEKEWIEQISQELIEMGVVKKSAKQLSAQVISLKNGFPVPTLQFFKTILSQAECSFETFENFYLLGRATGRAWFMEEVCHQIFQDLQRTAFLSSSQRIFM